MLQRPHFLYHYFGASIIFLTAKFFIYHHYSKKQTQPFHKILGLLAQIDAKILSRKD